MRNSKIRVYLCCGLLSTLISCSTFQLTEFGNYNQSNNNVSYTSTLNDTVLSMDCNLLSIKTSSFETLSFPINNSKPSLIFINNGGFKGFALCNSFYGSYTKKGNEIYFRNKMMTRVNCWNNDIESLITQTLLYVNNYTISNKQLFLKKGSDVLMILQINN